MKSLIISPHPDDEVLGAGGTLFKRKTIKKNLLYWIIVTRLKPTTSKRKILTRNKEIKKISKIFGFKKVFQLNFNTTELDSSSKKKLIQDFSPIIILEFSKFIKKNKVFNYSYLESFLKEFDYLVYDTNYKQVSLKDILDEIDKLPQNMFGVGNKFLVKNNSLHHKIINKIS